jgi:hypothetical protein
MRKPLRDGVAVFWVAEELKTAGLHKAHFNNARPVSCHHPMNMIIRRQLVAVRQYGVKLD